MNIASTILLTGVASRGFSKYQPPGGGGGGGTYTPTDSLYNAKYAAAMGAIPGGAKWVATTGNDTTGNGTSGNPYLTIVKALQSISGSGTVVVKDGTYTGANNWINEYTAAPPSGSAGNFTVIRAENPFGVRITQTARPSGYTQSIVNLTNQYIWIDGLICETTWTAAGADDNADVVVNAGVNNRISRCIVKRSSSSRYGGAYGYGNGSVLEDCHAYGSGRYVYQGGSGGASTPTGTNVLRRCLSYLSSGQAREPTASFNFYGADDRTYALVKDVAFINCYELDSPHIPYWTGGAENAKWGSWYFPKSVRNMRMLGCGSLNCGGDYAGFSGDGIQGNSGQWAEVKDSFVWGFAQSGAGGNVAGFWHNDGATNLVTYFRTGNLGGATAYSTQGATESGGQYSGTPTNLLQRSVSNTGCRQLYTLGPLLSGFGDANYDVEQTDLPLWPFPYESYIKAVFSETMTVPAGDRPNPGGSTSNPFAGNNMAGTAMRVTDRFWEATGTQTPDFSTVYT